MTKNFAFGILFIAVSLGLGALFIQQQGNQKNPLENNQITSATPAPSSNAADATPTPFLRPTQTPEIGQNSSQSGTMVTMSNGLKILDLKVGGGTEAKTGDTVTVNYLGTLENGTKFDSSYDRNQPFTTQIGVGAVIKGWDEGIPGMKVGGKRKLIIPPELGYGAQATGPIPPNSTLVFEVELVSIK
ncbi:MAG: FKBP-type peptidyl-prolyl cis-trans isomerase [Patescibacteria group bacterium]|nr:FKBP-type peptidyl-prolyl cis-trans isomerase [Patescibacteria group bacterium]